MGRREKHAAVLSELADWPAHLRANSGLPGPRADLELVQAVADVGTAQQFDELIDTDEEYLVLCGVVGLGRRLAAQEDVADRLRTHAADARWRVREGVAMALQRLGDASPPQLYELATAWATDPHPLVRRAAVAGLCEPRLLTSPPAAACALAVCATVTDAFVAIPADQRSDGDVRTLRKALGYCWSIAVAADPAPGLARFAALASSTDRDVRWIVNENRKKARMPALYEPTPG